MFIKDRTVPLHGRGCQCDQPVPKGGLPTPCFHILLSCALICGEDLSAVLLACRSWESKTFTHHPTDLPLPMSPGTFTAPLGGISGLILYMRKQKQREVRYLGYCYKADGWLGWGPRILPLKVHSKLLYL